MQMAFPLPSPHSRGGRGCHQGPRTELSLHLGKAGLCWEGRRRQTVLTEPCTTASRERGCLFFTAQPNLFSPLQTRLQLEKGRIWRGVTRWAGDSLEMFMGSEADGCVDSAQSWIFQWVSQIWGLSGKQAGVSCFCLPRLGSCLGSKENFCADEACRKARRKQVLS